ncbi:hypothetical protein PoB_005792700 [Plakobranchus ocellatus]|uniref:Uncharacterized protein n=1 Tax=Plakobranchus ocellatus TaxID=259542 RepID=A0AAV4CIE4_9GAST|nr:hypothetical protein PoB_005792700 [Plakobranchus ocellatus]
MKIAAEADVAKTAKSKDEPQIAKLKTARAHTRTPFFARRVIAFASTDPVAGIILGNIPEVDDKLQCPPTNKDDDDQDR